MLKEKFFKKLSLLLSKFLNFYVKSWQNLKMEIVIIKFFRIPKLNFNEIDYRINF